MKEVTIAKMQHSHVAAVASLERQCFGLRAWSERLLAEELSDSDKYYFVALCDGNAVGYAGFARVLDEAHIMNIAVEENYRRMGIGSALLAKVLSEATAAGCIATTLEVNAANKPARALYEQAGFTCAGLRPNYYGKGEHAAIYWLGKR